MCELVRYQPTFNEDDIDKHVLKSFIERSYGKQFHVQKLLENFGSTITQPDII